MTVPPPIDFADSHSAAIHSIVFCGMFAAGGLLVLHFATRNKPVARGEVSFLRGAIIVVAGLLLIALPLAAWVASFQQIHGRREQRVTPAELFLVAGYLNAAFLWLIWNVNSYACRDSTGGETPWERNWGESYSPELKKRLIGSLLEQLERDGKIGDVVVDVGSGAVPVSRLAPASADRKFILVDIAATQGTTPDTLYVRFDAEQIAELHSLSYRRALIRAGRFLSVDPQTPTRADRVTTMVFSDLLNYVDFRKVIRGFARFLQPDGRIIILNRPSRGIREEFSEQGLKSNHDLYPFLQELDFAIESKDFPCRTEGVGDESDEWLVLVARKSPSEAGETPTNAELMGLSPGSS